MGDGQCLKKAGGWGCGGGGGYYVPFVSGSLLSVQHGGPRNRSKGQQMCLSGVEAVHVLRFTVEDCCSCVFLWIYQKLKVFVSRSRLFRGLSFRSHPPTPY